MYVVPWLRLWCHNSHGCFLFAYGYTVLGISCGAYTLYFTIITVLYLQGITSLHGSQWRDSPMQQHNALCHLLNKICINLPNKICIDQHCFVCYQVTTLCINLAFWTSKCSASFKKNCESTANVLYIVPSIVLNPYTMIVLGQPFTLYLYQCCPQKTWKEFWVP